MFKKHGRLLPDIDKFDLKKIEQNVNDVRNY